MFTGSLPNIYTAWKMGFITVYSMTAFEEDFAEIAGVMFSNDQSYWQAINTHPKLKQKFDLVVDFYNSIDSTFTEEYFREISGQLD